ncbi:MAG: riboflavin synthase [Pseudomonadota bacterium]
MFTGLVQRVGEILRARPCTGGKSLDIRASESWTDLVLGESIAVDGVCLTVTEFRDSHFSVDVSFETLSRSTLGAATPGRRVNLERALRLSDRLGGHLVSGHVDAIATLRSIRPKGEFREIVVDAPRDAMHQIAKKGSVALDGVSLTVNEISGDSFVLAVIPHTLSGTTLEGWRPGRKINLETDLIAKYLERLTERSGAATRLEEWFSGSSTPGREGR